VSAMRRARLLLGGGPPPPPPLPLTHPPKSVLPTILRSSVPLVVPHGVAGVAFGLYIVAENFGKVVGNPLMGYLRDAIGNYVLDQQIFVGMSSVALLLCCVIDVLDATGARALRQRGVLLIPVQRLSIDTEGIFAAEAEAAVVAVGTGEDLEYSLHNDM
jgi:hypothetical protein